MTQIEEKVDLEAPGNRLQVVSLHFTNACDFNCPFCYVDTVDKKESKLMDKDLMMGLPKQIVKFAPQVALGGGEPLLYPEIVRDFAKECSDNGLICNITTNGNRIKYMGINQIIDIFLNIEMVSFSFDIYKVDKLGGIGRYINNAMKVKDFTGCKIGVNLLMNERLFKSDLLEKFVNTFFDTGFDRVFLLHPKNFSLGVNLKDFEHRIRRISSVYDGFFVDELTSKILNDGYGAWEKPCHYGSKMFSIDYEGNVYGCSFDKEPIFKMEKPRHFIKILSCIDRERRYECPYLVMNDE